MGNSFSTGQFPCDAARVSHERFGPSSCLVHNPLPILSSAEAVKVLVSERKLTLLPSWRTAAILRNSEHFFHCTVESRKEPLPMTTYFTLQALLIPTFNKSAATRMPEKRSLASATMSSCY